MANDFYLILSLTFALYMPAAIANMSPVIFAQINFLKFLKYPLDRGMTLKKEPLFGANKTYLGLISAVLGGGIGGILVGISGISLFENFEIVWFFLWGCVIGLGAILGDLCKSFIKRRLQIKAGKPFVPWDQIDFVIGAWFFHQLFYRISIFLNYPTPPAIDFKILFVGILIIPPLHLLANILAYKMRWKKVWW